jgi:hypothetical protein
VIGGNRLERESIKRDLREGIQTESLSYVPKEATVYTGNDIEPENLRAAKDSGAHIIDLGPDDLHDPVEAESAADQREKLGAYADNPRYYDLSNTQVRHVAFSDPPVVVAQTQARVDKVAENLGVTYEPPWAENKPVQEALNLAWAHRVAVENPYGFDLGPDPKRAGEGPSQWHIEEAVWERAGITWRWKSLDD